MNFVLTTAIIGFVLVTRPWLGSFSDEMKIVLVGALAVLLSLSIRWILDFFCSPKTLDGTMQNEVKTNRKAILVAVNEESKKRALSIAALEGRKIATGSAGTDADWKEWEDRVSRLLAHSYRVTEQHGFAIAGLSSSSARGSGQAMSDVSAYGTI